MYLSAKTVTTDYKNKLMEWASGNKEGRRRKGERERGKNQNELKGRGRKGERRDVGEEEKGRGEREIDGRRISWGEQKKEDHKDEGKR